MGPTHGTLNPAAPCRQSGFNGASGAGAKTDDLDLDMAGRGSALGVAWHKEDRQLIVSADPFPTESGLPSCAAGSTPQA